MTHYYKINCVRDNLKLIREFVNVVLKELSLNDVEINQLVLAVDEVCSNLIIHSQKCNPYNFIEINIQDQNNTIVFEIIDPNNEHFDPTQYMNPNLTKIVKEKRKGGLGLMLVNKIMDTVEVVSQDTQNIWRMTKHVKTSLS
jgi:serine/threonine-protein kinase RsbW